MWARNFHLLQYNQCEFVARFLSLYRPVIGKVLLLGKKTLSKKASMPALRIMERHLAVRLAPFVVSQLRYSSLFTKKVKKLRSQEAPLLQCRSIAEQSVILPRSWVG
jgi:hypothetical protein